MSSLINISFIIFKILIRILYKNELLIYKYNPNPYKYQYICITIYLTTNYLIMKYIFYRNTILKEYIMKNFLALTINGKLRYELIFEKLFFLLLIFAFIFGIVNKNSFIYLSSLLTVAVSLLIKLVFMYTKFKATPFLYFLSQLFIFLSMFLGRIVSIYSIFPYWDKFVHFYSGIILFFIGLAIFSTLCKSDLNKNFSLIILFSIFFSISMAGLWEIYEFTTDALLNLIASLIL